MKESVFYVKLSLSIPVPIKMYQAPGTEDPGRQQQQVRFMCALMCGSNKCVVNMYFSIVLTNFLKNKTFSFCFSCLELCPPSFYSRQTTYRTVNED